jgi:hypothetical protein
LLDPNQHCTEFVPEERIGKETDEPKDVGMNGEICVSPQAAQAAILAPIPHYEKRLADHEKQRGGGERSHRPSPPPP